MSHWHKLPLLENYLTQHALPTWPKSSLKLRDADLLGLTIYGDGATIDKRPLINIMTANAYNPQALWNVVDCLDHFADGDIKDAQYSALKHIPVMQKFDPNCDWVFDGASNVQNGGMPFVQSSQSVLLFIGQRCVITLYERDFQQECLQSMKKFTCIVSSIGLLVIFASFLILHVD